MVEYSRLLGQQVQLRRVDPQTVLGGSYLKPGLTLIRRVGMVIWGYWLAVWLYVIAMQLRYPNSVRWLLAVWLPVRLDYLGEAAFFLSFVFALIALSF